MAGVASGPVSVGVMGVALAVLIPVRIVAIVAGVVVVAVALVPAVVVPAAGRRSSSAAWPGRPCAGTATTSAAASARKITFRTVV